MAKVTQTAGRTQLGGFAPKFAELNDDVLFGEVWSGDGLSLKLRSILTVSALVSKGMVDSSFQFHVVNGRKNGVTKGEMAEILTHLAFYAGWPNAWAAFSGAGTLAAVAGVTLTGGADGTVGDTAYASFLEALEPCSFDVLAYDGEDSAVNQALIAFVKRISAQEGRYAQLVTTGAANADSRFVIHSQNMIDIRRSFPASSSR